MPGHHCGRVIHQTSRQHRSFAMKRAQGSDYLLLGGCSGIQMAGSWQLNSLKRNAGRLPLSGKCWQAPSPNTVMTERTGRQGTDGFFLTDRRIYYWMVTFFYCKSTWINSSYIFCRQMLVLCILLAIIKNKCAMWNILFVSADWPCHRDVILYSLGCLGPCGTVCVLVCAALMSSLTEIPSVNWFSAPAHWERRVFVILIDN